MRTSHTFYLSSVNTKPTSFMNVDQALLVDITTSYLYWNKEEKNGNLGDITSFARSLLLFSVLESGCRLFVRLAPFFIILSVEIWVMILWTTLTLGVRHMKKMYSYFPTQLGSLFWNPFLPPKESCKSFFYVALISLYTYQATSFLVLLSRYRAPPFPSLNYY